MKSVNLDHISTKDESCLCEACKKVSEQDVQVINSTTSKMTACLDRMLQEIKDNGWAGRIILLSPISISKDASVIPSLSGVTYGKEGCIHEKDCIDPNASIEAMRHSLSVTNAMSREAFSAYDEALMFHHEVDKVMNTREAVQYLGKIMEAEAQTILEKPEKLAEIRSALELAERRMQTQQHTKVTRH